MECFWGPRGAGTHGHTPALGLTLCERGRWRLRPNVAKDSADMTLSQSGVCLRGPVCCWHVRNTGGGPPQDTGRKKGPTFCVLAGAGMCLLCQHLSKWTGPLPPRQGRMILTYKFQVPQSENPTTARALGPCSSGWALTPHDGSALFFFSFTVDSQYYISCRCTAWGLDIYITH